MAKPDAHIKRVKSLSLIAFATALLSYNVFESGRLLESAVETAEAYFLGSSLLEARVPKDGAITTVLEEPAEVWLRRYEGSPPLPTIGKIVDLGRAWNVTTGTISGVFTLSNNESVSFLGAYDASHLSEHNGDWPSTDHCGSTTVLICQFYQLTSSATLKPHNLAIAYAESGDADRAIERRNWYFSEDGFHTLLTRNALNSEIVRIAANWVSSSKSADAAYFSLRDKLAQRVVKIPVIGLEVSAPTAAIYLSVFALAVSVLLTHSILSIGSILHESVGEPWVILYSEAGLGPWQIKIQRVISHGSGAVLMAVLWSPVAIGLFCAGFARDGASLVVIVPCILLTAVLSTASAFQFWSVAFRTRSSIGSEHA